VPMQDWELLADYLRTGSQTAFAEVVERYINLVYATCLREIKNPQLAEDATQVVFLILVKKAHTIRSGTVLASWLFNTARFVALDVIRYESRRQRREQKAAAMMIQNLGQTSSNLDWEHIEPLLHEALEHLNTDDRNAVLLRYFEGKSLRQTGQAMGISEDAARLRVVRAVEKMRRFFSRHGFPVGAAVLVGVIYDHAGQAAPASCHAAVLQLGQYLAVPGSGVAGAVTSASAGSAGSGLGGGLSAGLTTNEINVRVLSLAERVLRTMLMNYIKIGVTACAGLVLTLGGVGELAHLAWGSVPSAVRATQPPTGHATVPHRAPQSTLDRHKITRLAQAPGKAKGAANSASLNGKIKIGEIQVEGRIRSVDVKQRVMVLEVAAFTLPDGKTHELNPVKPKTITMNATTGLHARDAKQQAVSLDALQNLGSGVFAVVVGRDLGSGKSLPARDIAVWNRVSAGQYHFDYRLEPSTTLVAPPLAPAPSVAAAPISPPAQPVAVAPALRPSAPGTVPDTTNGAFAVAPEPVPAGPVPASKVTAAEILNQLWATTKTTHFYRASILATMAYGDPDTALQLAAGSADAIPDERLGPIIVALAEADPERAARLAPDRLPQLKLPFWRFRATARTAVLLAAKEPKVATDLYLLAQSVNRDLMAKAPVNHVNNAERLATLSWLAHKLRGDDEARPYDDALVREIKAMRSRPWWALQQLYALAPRADLLLLNQVTAPDRQAGNNEGALAIRFAAMIAAHFDPPRAWLLFNSVLPALTQQDPNPPDAEPDTVESPNGVAGELLVRSLDKSNATMALEVARSISDTDVYNKPVALATAATYQPHDVALQVLREAEALLKSPTSGFDVPAHVAAIAYSIDPTIGRRLFAVAKKRFDGAATQRQHGDNGPSIANFAFYYSRIDPARCRQWLEDEFAQTQVRLKDAATVLNQLPVDPNGQPVDVQASPDGAATNAQQMAVYTQQVEHLSQLAVAMVAVDPNRAWALARRIPVRKTDGHNNPPFQAQRDIALFLLLPESERFVKPFREWDPGSLWRA